MKGRKIMQTPRTNKMESAPVNKLLLTMSLPIMFSMMMQAFYNMIDSIFIARFSEKALSAISLTFPMQTLMIAISIGTYIGLNAFLARTLGQKDFKKRRRSYSTAYLCLCFPALQNRALAAFRHNALLSCAPWASKAFGSFHENDFHRRPCHPHYKLLLRL